MLSYYNDLEICGIVFFVFLTLFCAIAALGLYICQRIAEKKLERLHRKAAFERIKRERDEAFKVLQRHERFKRIQEDIGKDYQTEREKRRIRTEELIRDVDELMEFDSLRNGAYGS